MCEPAQSFTAVSIARSPSGTMPRPSRAAPGDGGRALVRTRLLTVADDLGAIGGAEIAQLRVVAGLASTGWAVELLYVSRGDLWPQWNAFASSTRAVTGLAAATGCTAP